MSRSAKQTFSRLLNYLAESTWFAYVTIVLLQVKVMLWIWEYRDLTSGDASSYYTYVLTLLDEAKVNIVWSPVYTVFLAALHRLFDDPFWVLTTAQIGIAICASVLALALFRRLLPKHIAWLIAAWWAVLPINFDTAYNVHLFSTLFPLMIFVVAAYAKNIYGRGIVLGGLLFTAVLVRNEYSALFMLWLIVLAGYEFYVYRWESRPSSLRTYLFAYGLPALAVLLIIGLFYANSRPQYPEIKNSLEAKHTLNVCQIYAYNRIQQGDSWNGDPWTECQDLIARDFGQSKVTFSRAFSLNPRAILEHIWWNIKLIPSGTQLALFNHYAGGPNPDYMPARQSSLVWGAFLLVLGLSAFAAMRHFILPGLKKRQPIDNGFVWLLMLSAALLVLGIMMMQRPRPSYMFPYSIFLMALSGLGLHGLFELMRLGNAAKVLAPIAGILLILLMPSYYKEGYVNPFGQKGQVLRDIYGRIAPHIKRAPLESPVLLVPPVGNYISLCNYLGGTCRVLDWEEKSSSDGVVEQVFGNPGGSQGENLYVLYLEDMIWKFPSRPSQNENEPAGYVELICFSFVDNVISCRDGIVDLNRGVMNDGAVDIPLRAALFVNDGNLVGEMDYGTDRGYYLQVLMKDNKINRILVADDHLFRTNFNQQYLLGKYDRQYFEEVFNDFPEARILKVKSVEAGGSAP